MQGTGRIVSNTPNRGIAMDVAWFLNRRLDFIRSFTPGRRLPSSIVGPKSRTR